MRNFAKVVCLLAVLLMAVPSAVHAGYQYQIQIQTETFQVPANSFGINGNGGRFTGHWYDAAGTTEITSLLKGGFWCVDVNNFVSPPTSQITADVVGLGSLAPQAGGVDAWTASNARKGLAVFTNDVATLTAQQRYQMAAALIAGYAGPGYSEGIVGPSVLYAGSGATTNDIAIQRAIWYALNAPGTSGLNVTSLDALSQSYYDAAKAFVLSDTKNSFRNWVLFSPPDAGGSVQAFLGEVVPEPAFLGFLALGLTGLYVARRRRLT